MTFTFSSLYADDLSGKTYYTKTNIWYEKPHDISSTNYHRGSILPIGSKVKINSIKNKKIHFTPDGSSKMFTIINETQRSMMSTEELFNRYFSVEAVQVGSGDYQATDAEREHIKNGTIAIGMSKKAVLMAYGYPPAHKTPLLTSDVWHYWYTIPQQVIVHFKDDKIVKIEKIKHKAIFIPSRSDVNTEGGAQKAK
jgi:hypothetical protein